MRFNICSSTSLKKFMMLKNNVIYILEKTALVTKIKIRKICHQFFFEEINLSPILSFK